MVALLRSPFPATDSLGDRPAGPAAPETVPESGDDAALVARARQDLRAFEPLYRRYADPVYRYCHRRLGTREAAEDATALVFAKALAALPAYGGGPFRSWLFAIAHNVLVDSYRAARPDQPLAAAAEVVASDPSPEDLAVAADEARWLQTVLARLPADQRRVVELRLTGLTGPEIARALGRNHAAVRSAQSRAVGRLRSILGVVPPRGEGSDGGA